MESKNIRIKVEEIMKHIEDGYAPNTIRAYRFDFNEFMLFAENTDCMALPAEPDLIAKYLIRCSQNGIKNSTILRKVGSISAIHRFANYADPTKHPEVKLSLRKIARRLGSKFNQAYPINKDLLEKMISVCGEDLMGKRNKMLLLLAYHSLRRRSELVSLRVEDIDLKENGNCMVLLRGSKTDQSRNGHWIALGPETTNSIIEWLQFSGINDGLLLRGIKGNKLTEGLDPCRINRIFKKLAIEVGMPKSIVKQISGHSTRVGCAQDMLKAGASLIQIMVRGGWSKPDTVLRYVGKLTYLI
jgi:site-specific recombinase XerD